MRNHLPTKRKKKKNKIILFFKSINCCQKKKKSQTKTFFYYFNIAFEMSCIVEFFIFGVQNTKYLPFRIPNASGFSRWKNLIKSIIFSEKTT